ncbi:MAG: thioredoxin [Acidaminococcaceae bacterium]
MVKLLSTENFLPEITATAQPTLVDFWAPWCGYCRRLAPLLENLADTYADNFNVGKVNVDEEPDLAAQYDVNTLPTLLLFKNGIPGTPLIAPDSKAKIVDWLKEQGVL